MVEIARQMPEDAPLLLSLPQASVRHAAWLNERGYGRLFLASDPPGRQLGSGGGTAALLHAAWRAEEGKAGNMAQWLQARRRILVHGSGESRRLPSYAAVGKPLIPLPILPLRVPQAPDPILLDLQRECAARLMRAAPDTYRLELVCGDVFVHFDRCPPAFPQADVLIAGLPASPEEARHHGVMVCEKGCPDRLVRFLQKPSPERVLDLSRAHECWLDTGTWFFSSRALRVLFGKCGWNASSGEFPADGPKAYDLYGTFGLGLGADPVAPDPEIRGLSAAVLPVPDGRFYHFGTSRGMILSTRALDAPAAQRRSFGDGDPGPSLVVLNSDVGANASGAQETWIENSVIPADWRLARRHVLTGIPANDWALHLEEGVCVDVSPVDGGGTAVRPYGFDDPMRGHASDPSTTFLGRPFAEWMAKHGVSPAAASVAADADVFDAPLFPVIPRGRPAGDIVRWMIARCPRDDDPARDRWLKCRRLSARECLGAADLTAARGERVERIRKAFVLTAEAMAEPPLRLDLGALAALMPTVDANPGRVIQGVPSAHGSMCASARAALDKRSDQAAAFEAEAFAALRDSLVHEMEVAPVRPRRNVLDDQIVWGRSPVRLDLAGGWTDTPPYCIEHGGRVVNVAVDLNGQPPIQVFGRLTREPHIVVRSIDLGIEDRIDSYESLGRFGELGSGFGIARAALALAGFDSRFLDGARYRSLQHHLESELGGGIDLAMLAAVPKGSGLGTSSILAATVLGTLSELLGLGWSQQDLVVRTLVLEQILGAGGGWQDQVGGVTRGLKLIETRPGLVQNPVLRWLPDRLFGGPHANRTVLLYYTGLTRVAHGILNEIVRGLFLNTARHVGAIHEIGENAAFAADALQRGEWDGLCEAVRRSWILNRHLDAGTNPPAVQAIVERIGDLAAAVKLLGAGGGGYLLILARDDEAGERIRKLLTQNPPNSAARFVSMGVSETGFQATRS